MRLPQLADFLGDGGPCFSLERVRLTERGGIWGGGCRGEAVRFYGPFLDSGEVATTSSSITENIKKY